MTSVERPPLRDAQREATRDRIVTAVAELVTEGHPAAISVPAVSRRSGVSVATIYRYFPTKEALLDAAATIEVAQALESIVNEEMRADDSREALRRSYRKFSEHVPLLRNQLATPVGRELRKTRRAGKRAHVEHLGASFGARADGPGGPRFMALGEALMSSAVFLEFHDQVGLDADTAAEYLAWAMRALAEATAREQQEQA